MNMGKTCYKTKIGEIQAALYMALISNVLNCRSLSSSTTVMVPNGSDSTKFSCTVMFGSETLSIGKLSSRSYEEI